MTTTRPSGACRLLRLLHPLLLVFVADAQGAEPPAGRPADPQELSGEWKGFATDFQRGKCEIDGDLRSSHRTTVHFEFAPDGSFTAVEKMKTRTRGPADEPPLPAWRGSMSADGALEVLAARRSDCSGSRRDYETRLGGSFEPGKKKDRIVLEGDDAPCPDMGCVFRRKYELSRKRISPRKP